MTSLPNTGFILTRQKVEYGGLCYLEYWLLTDAGPVKLRTPAQRELFFVRQKDCVQVSQQLAAIDIIFELKELELKDFTQESIAAVYFDRGVSAFKARQQLKEANILCYEDDIRLTERFLMERFIYGGVSFYGELIDSGNSYLSYRNVHLKPSDYIPNYKLLSLDIECSESGELYSVGLLSKGYQCVIMVGEYQAGAPAWITWVASEKSLLQQLLQAVNDFDPDIFIGWNVVNFDFKLIIKRAKIHGVNLTLGRDQSEIHWRDSASDANQGYVTMSGRLLVDGIDALKTATYQFESFSLEHVSQQLLKKGKKLGGVNEVVDIENRMAAINHDFLYNKVKLAEYNLQDCLLVLEIFEYTKVLSFLTLRSQLTGLELDRQGGSVAAFINLYLPKLHRAGYVSPNRPENGGLASPGGYVMDSRPGLYQQVLVLDFKSLYPSIIRTFKIDPLGLIEGLKGDAANGIQGYKGAIFSRDQHFLPDIITSLWLQRDEAKKNKDTARSQAIKILMNSFYGVLGSGGCPFYDTRLASSITLRGHEIMQTTAKWIEQEGYQVIYGDTDSTFIWLDGNYSDQEAHSIGEHLQSLINTQWVKKIRMEHQLECFLEIEFETHFTQFLMPTIRGSKQGSKKRYAGIKYDGGSGELVFKGLETVRSDWTALAKNFQQQLYQMVFAGENVEHYLRNILIAIQCGEHDEDLVYRKRLRRPLGQYVKNIPPHVKAARQADHLNQSLGKPLRYQYKGWISYIVTINGPEVVEHRRSPIDYDHYIKKQIQPIAEAILPFIDTSFEQITDSQLRLFN